MRRRWLLGLVAVALVAAACGGGAGGSDERSRADGGDEGDFVEVEQIAPSPRDDGPSALDNPRAEGFPTPLIDLDEMISGGPPPDGIPPIDEPKFVRANSVGFLDDAEPVLALEIDGDARAYPAQILTWHEIVNDTVGGVPVAVTFCPLCNSAVAVDRRVGERVLSFGTSGMLFQSALVMYDRQTESLWSHFTAEGIVGTLTGSKLEQFPMATVSWGDWRKANTDGLVLSRETGHSRPYGRNPYEGYDDPDSHPFLFRGDADPRLAVKQRVVGIRRGEHAAAVRLDALAKAGVLQVTLGDERLAVFHRPGTASALDDADIAKGKDVGATGVFVPVVDGQELEFERRADGFTDAQTRSTWDIFGEAVSGPLQGHQLEAVSHLDTFWFAWASFQPETTIVPPS